MWNTLVFTMHTIGIYDILIIQDKNGKLLSIKINEYEPEESKTTEHFYNDENIH